MRITLTTIVLVIVFMSNAQNAEVGFVCGPCGCGQDEVFHDKPGNCEACGMELFAAYKRKYKPSRGQVTNAPRKTVAILLFPGVQIIDYTGPWEVFGQANWNVFTVAKTDELLETAMGMQVKPHYTFKDVPEADFLLVPGGNVQHNDTDIQKWLQQQATEKEQILSVCNGAYHLGAAGLLDGKQATTFAPLIPGLSQVAPKAEVLSDVRWTDNGKILTSAGLSSGIDAAIYLVSKYQGLGNAQRIATHLEYDWSPDKGFVRASLADMHLQGFGQFINQFDREWLRYEGDQNEWYMEVAVDTELSESELMKVIEFQAEKGYDWAKSGKGWTYEVKGQQWEANFNIEKGEAAKKIIKFRVQKA
ncbi:MAG: DJ-1/PfpI family protein [Cytophagales bacterium]|nr:DJ-1/PfpI family protein [Cytophagales bacterium]